MHGRPGARFLYLCWCAVNRDGFAMFSRIKLMFGVPTQLLRAAHDGGMLVSRLGLANPNQPDFPEVLRTVTALEIYRTWG